MSWRRNHLAVVVDVTRDVAPPIEWRFSQASECGTKRRYASAVDARQYRRDRSLKPYLCSWCGYFHVGHKPLVPARGEVPA